MKKACQIGTVILTVFLLAVFAEAGGTFSASDAANLEKAGVPVYPKAIMYALTEKPSGKWMSYTFASSDKPEDVTKWYKEKLPEWSAHPDQKGVFYNGKPGVGLMEIGLYTNVWISEEKGLPEWYSECG